MSGCYPSETQNLLSCNHGVVGFCYQCDLNIWRKLREFEVRIEGLHAYKLQQIDNNKELSLLVSAHEDYLKSIHKIALCDPDKVMSNYNHLDKRLDSFESDVAKDIVNINEQIDKLNKFNEFNAEFITIFKNRIEKLELKTIEDLIKRIADLERHFADFMQKSSLNCQKQPFKCPVCNGCGSDPTGLYPCKSCEGKGIVWSP